MRRMIVASFVFALLVSAMAVRASDGEKKAVTNKKCPVMKSDVSADFRAEYKNQYVYFCCQGCVSMFEKDPEKYVAKLSEEDREAIKANDICPMTKDPIQDHTRFVEHEGRKVYFCCDGCVEMFKEKIAEKKTN